MSIGIKELGIDRFSIDDRLALIEEIWHSLTNEIGEVSLSHEQRVELDRRSDALAHSPGDVVPWEIVKAEALAQIRS